MGRYVPKGVGSCNVLVVNKQPFHFLTGVMESMHFGLNVKIAMCGYTEIISYT
jgi:hypothetical protein